MANLVFAGAGHVFPPLVREFNLLRPARQYYLAETPTVYVGGWDNADYVKDWMPFNLKGLVPGTGPNTDTVTFGAFTTAPDGTTNTARLIVENTTNNEHSITAGLSGHVGRFYGKLRFAGVFKYAGRRIVMTLTTATQIDAGVSTAYGCKAVFDLLNGQVAQELTYFGATPVFPWILYPSGIRAIGNGWYLCYIEVQPNRSVDFNGGITLYGKVSLDNHLGTAIERSSYTGDGASGVYAWRSNLMPSRAWTLFTETVFFDDFDDDTRANIDLGNTKAPGYDWYEQSAWPAWDYDYSFAMDPPPEETIVADSTISLDYGVRQLGTAASTWEHPEALGLDPATPDRNYSSGYVGQVFGFPGLFEGRMKWNEILGGGVSMWGVAVEWLTIGRFTTSESWIQANDFTWMELWNGLVSRVHFKPATISNDDYIQIAQTPAIYTDITTWEADLGYGGLRHVERLGTLYTSITAPEIGHAPESYPLEWGPYTPTRLGVTPPVFNSTEFHDFSYMCLPYSEAEGEAGQCYAFLDRGFASVPLVWGPDLDPSLTNSNTYHLMHLTDYQSRPIFIGGSPGLPLILDWVKVRQ